MSIAHSLICRPSTSGGVIIVANCELDVPQTSDVSSIEIPSDFMISKIVERRVRLHFNNDGEIEIEGFVIHYAVSLEGPCSLVYVCVAGPALPSQRAQEFLRAVKLCIHFFCGSENILK
ncbi:hypothetical protein ANCCAN_25387 [Ancylostoma caninum]|uniref:Longin domain-containing protein n=1 Tax=Ancylostoma caninum TaxID=29170 RepID=A0A368FDJ7_ANCCA|nr:hypothetical protein ANCCAN_25387 [Ancylostoma caninum]